MSRRAIIYRVASRRGGVDASSQKHTFPFLSAIKYRVASRGAISRRVGVAAA